jgi:hypothetical protein
LRGKVLTTAKKFNVAKVKQQELTSRSGPPRTEE